MARGFKYRAERPHTEDELRRLEFLLELFRNPHIKIGDRWVPVRTWTLVDPAAPEEKAP